MMAVRRNVLTKAIGKKHPPEAAYDGKKTFLCTAQATLYLFVGAAKHTDTYMTHIQAISPKCASRAALVLILCLAAQQAAPAAAALPGPQSQAGLMRRVASLPTDSIMSLAAREQSAAREERAMTLYMMVASRTEGKKDARSQSMAATAGLRLGEMSYSHGDYTRAMRLFVGAMEAAGRAGRRDLQMELYKWMGNVYCMFTDYPMALRCYAKGLDADSAGAGGTMAYRLLVNSAYASAKMGQARKARRYLEEAKATPHESRPEFSFIERSYLAIILEAERDYAGAAAALRPLVGYSVSHGLPPEFECTAYEGLYRAYYLDGRRDSALYWLGRCLDKAERAGLLHMFSESLDVLARYYSDCGDERMAAAYRERYRRIVDSTFNVREFSRAKDMQFLYEMNKIDSELSRLTADKERDRALIRLQQTLIVVIAVVAIAVGLLLAIAWRQTRRLRESYRSLFDLNCRVLGLQPGGGGGAPRDAGHKYSTSNLDAGKLGELIARIAAVMDETLAYADADFSLERLAELVGSNSKYVSQVNEHYGKNFSSFVTDYRIRLACRRLADDEAYGAYTIEGVGRSVGYRSKTTFTAAFRRVTGLTPSAWLKLERERRSASSVGQDASEG